MTSRKHTGSYYTPDFLSGFIMNYISTNFNNANYISIFEPSVGDGSFVKAFKSCDFPLNIKKFKFTALDKIESELQKAKQSSEINDSKNTDFEFYNDDFLKYQIGLKDRFHLIAGNPPYIKKQLLNFEEISLCNDIHWGADLPSTTVKNIWSAFLIRCSQLLTDDGVLAFVLPADLLQVKFSTELRALLIKTFQRTEIFTFDDLMFECKGQDTVLLIAYKKNDSPGQFYTHISSSAQLIDKSFSLAQNHSLIKTETKWTHHLLSSEELNFLYNTANKLHKVGHYCDSKPGIVTAANNFFIVNEKTETDYELNHYTKPIIQKGLFVNGSVVFDYKSYLELVKNSKPTKILVLNDDDKGKLSKRVEDYLQIGVDQELPDRYKCSQRKNWFVIPNISSIPEAFYFKRSHHYPKLIKNDAGVLVTDSGYKIKMNDGYDINSMIYSFYNSLTLTFAELEGRYYGGGVLELTPSEFRKLPIPYLKIEENDFKEYTQLFESKSSITDILDLNDCKILQYALGLNNDEIKKIKAIYQKLINKRLRKKTTEI